MTHRSNLMKHAGIAALLAFLALAHTACGEALDDPVEPEARHQQSLDMENANIETIRRAVEVCRECVEVEVFVLRQTTDSESDDDGGSDEDSDGDTDVQKIQQNKEDISGDSTIMDGNPVPFPLEPEEN